MRRIPIVSAGVLFIHAGVACGSYFPDWNYRIDRAGLYGPEYTGSAGLQQSIITHTSSTGRVVGFSQRFIGVNTPNGYDTWIYSQDSNATIRIGLAGSLYSSSAGLQASTSNFLNRSGQVAGVTERIAGLSTSNGRDAWVFSPATLTTHQIGLVGGVYTGLAGYQVSENRFQNQAGQITGVSQRVAAHQVIVGQDAWVYSPTTNATVQIGLIGDDYIISSSGYRTAAVEFQNETGQVSGWTRRFNSAGALRGQDTWVYSPVTNTTVRTGLPSEIYSNSAGWRSSTNDFQNEAGQIVGYSVRFNTATGNNGRDTWVFNPATNSTMQTGLTGDAYVGSGGYQFSQNSHQNQAGQVAGHSNRYIGVSTLNGQDTWVFNPATNSTIQTGLTGDAYVGSGGYQFSQNSHQNQAGQVVGTTNRYTGVNTLNGQDAWVFDPVTNATKQIGLRGGIHTGSAGRQLSGIDFQNGAGQVAGFSERFEGVNTPRGQDAWVYNPVSNLSLQIGLVGGAFTSPTVGTQFSSIKFQNESGQIVGSSRRYNAAGMNNGNSIWVYDPVSNTTIQTGLASANHVGTSGVRESAVSFQNAAGYVSGVSTRYLSNSSIYVGQDAWYFDPITRNTYQPTLGVADSIRISDGSAFSSISLITNDGFALGYYHYFPGGLSPHIERAFVFRPDLGFSDLGALVDGGLSAAGWSELRFPQFQSLMQHIVGSGYVEGQTGNSRSVFVMKLIPAPSGLALLGLGGLLAAKRRRR